MGTKLSVRNVYKIFGPNPKRAMEMIRQGLGKEEVFEKTGMTIGVSNAGFDVEEGEIFVVMGLSGSGKSTMVRMLNRLIDATAGSVLLDGRDITKMSRKELIEVRRRDISMVFQSFALMPHQTVLQNTAFGLEVAGMDRAEREKRAMDALDAVGLSVNADSFPDELSGGMQQRVGLARALAVNPGVLLMDEAFSALDPLIRTEMQDELLRLQSEHARTVIFITHDLDEAMRVGDRIAIMQSGEVVQVGTPEEIVRKPANEYVRSFFRGVDVSQVFSAGDVARRDQVTVIERPGVSVRAALQRLEKYDRNVAVVHDRRRQYMGTVTTDSLMNCLRGLSDEEDGDIEAAFVGEVQTARADQPLSEMLTLAADSPWPVPVVSEDGRYVGTISRAALLQTLSRSEQGVTS